MEQYMSHPPVRRERAHVSLLGTTQMHLRSPMVIALWSAIFPGLGHLLLSKYISGMLLFGWEIFINLKSHLNLSIFYTFTAQFELAKSVLDKRWLILYVPTYLFAIWDSYRSTVDMNNHFVLAGREDAPVKPFVINPLGFNYLDKSSPWVAMVWSMISPGVGQLIIHRILVAFFLLAWWIAVAYNSKLLPAIHFTAFGQFDLARSIIDKQWFLNIPSVFFFALYDAYTNTVESNKLYEWEQAKYFKKEYQSRNFKMPFHYDLKRGRSMYVVSGFEHSAKLETAVTALQMKGIAKDDILVIPLDKRNDGRMLFDRTHSSDSLSMVDFPIILATLFSLFGIIYGFLLTWGPVLWALIGTTVGFGAGILIKLCTTRHRLKKQRAQVPDVVLLIACTAAEIGMVRDILWDNGALGVSKLCLGDGP